MRREYLPYYLSRATISLGFSLLVIGLNWKAIIFSAVFFALFVLYLHSGWFTVNPDTPITPLRRDSHGKEIQRKALIFSLSVGTLVYILSPYLFTWFGFTAPRSISLVTGIITYFFVQFFLFIRR